MGGSASSTVNQKYNTTIINKSDIELLNKNVNNFIANTIVNQASNCGTNSTQSQTIDMSNMTIEADGSVNIGDIGQTQTSTISFDCVQLSSFQNDIANGIMTQYTNALKNSYSTEALEKITAAADSSASTGFGSTGWVDTKSTTNVDYNFTNITDTNKKIQNIIENAITNNLSLNDTQSCISQVLSNQKFTTAGTTVKGTFTIGTIQQNQAATLMSECVQSKNNANKITNAIASEIGVQVDESNTVKKTTEMTSSAKSESTNVGFFQSIGQGISAMFSGLFSSPIGIICFICCCCICCLLSIAAAVAAASVNDGEFDDMIPADMLPDNMNGGSVFDYTCVERLTKGISKHQY